LSLNPALWLDAADTATIVESGGAVSQWNDKSGNGRNAVQATGANQPTTGAETLNGRNVLSWPITQNTQRLVTPSMTSQEAFIVNRYGDGTRTTWYFQFVGLLTLRDTDPGFTASASGTSVFFSSSHFQTFRLNNGLENNVPNAVYLPRPSTVTYGKRSTSFAGQVCVGHDRTNQIGRGWAGIIAEVIVFDRALTDSERLTTTNYLMNKWGIT
jgi:hypothetical protein